MKEKGIAKKNREHNMIEWSEDMNTNYISFTHTSYNLVTVKDEKTD